MRAPHIQKEAHYIARSWHSMFPIAVSLVPHATVLQGREGWLGPKQSSQDSQQPLHLFSTSWFGSANFHTYFLCVYLLTVPYHKQQLARQQQRQHNHVWSMLFHNAGGVTDMHITWQVIHHLLDETWEDGYIEDEFATGEVKENTRRVSTAVKELPHMHTPPSTRTHTALHSLSHHDSTLDTQQADMSCTEMRNMGDSVHPKFEPSVMVQISYYFFYEWNQELAALCPQLLLSLWPCRTRF